MNRIERGRIQLKILFICHVIVVSIMFFAMIMYLAADRTDDYQKKPDLERAGYGMSVLVIILIFISIILLLLKKFGVNITPWINVM